MKSSIGIVTKRQEKLIQYLKENGSIQVDDASRMFNVSPLTIRRDLQSFEERGLVERFYGGAILVQDALGEDPTYLPSNEELDHKKIAIAKAAANLIESGDTVFINSSSTALLAMSNIEKRATVITNNGKALSVPKNPNIDLILTGGEVYERKQSMVGDYAISIFNKISATKCIIGVSGINERGITTSVIQEVAVNRVMLERCKGQRIIVAQGPKVGIEHNFLTAELPLITHLITDSSANPEAVKRLEAKGIKVIQVDE
jgi:DeoR/GlpR family transcriptional regulator of sugar metabolism